VNIASTPHLQETASQWVAALNAYELPDALIRDCFTTFLLLRWADHIEAEQEAMAIFEERAYQPLLPAPLQWRNWSRLDEPRAMAERLHELAGVLDALHGEAAHPAGGYLPLLAEPLRRILNVSFFHFLDVLPWLGELPLETPGERREVLALFDRILTETGGPAEGVFTSPESIAQLVAALADPRPGERVYDPCFGAGNFLLAAWWQAEASRAESHRFGPLLEVAGSEINAGVYLVGLLRLLLAGVAAPRLALGDSLERETPSGRQGFDVVLADPPFRAKFSRESRRYPHFPIPSSDSVGLFIQHTLAQLKPLGRAVIVVPEGFLFTAGAARDLRRTLIERGQVEAVIGLPAGVYAPYTGVKISLLVLNKQGGASRVRMVDASSQFEMRSGRKAPFIRREMAQQLAEAVRRPELRPAREAPSWAPEDMPGTGRLARSIWEVSQEDLAAAEWDLTPRRREKGGLDALLASLKEALGESGEIASLAAVAQVNAGRSIKAADLLDEPPRERPMAYIRIKDLAQGRVGRGSIWLTPPLAEQERRWALLPGDLLLSKSGTLGKAALVREGTAGAVAANGLYVLRVDQQRLDPGFLLAYLASPACQNWLAAQSRGTVIQHLNRAVLDELPVPVPPLHLQARAAAQFREFGTDALAFLAQATGSAESDRLAAWLAELDGKVPRFLEGLDATPALTQLEPLVAMAGIARRWVEQELVGSSVARWLLPLADALLPLAGVAQIPPGPGLLNVLQEGERGLARVLEVATGHLPTETQARAIAERLRDWLRAASNELLASGDIRVRAAPASLTNGSFAEFVVELENEGCLPLRGFRVETTPDWGLAQTPYLPERGMLPLNLRGDVPKQGSRHELRLNWSARNLAGQPVSGEVELAIHMAAPDELTVKSSVELGGSPYVTGSPLEPRHGHDVFFGRKALIGQISRQIATHGNVVLLEGNRRAGKTSILKHLEGRDAISGWLAVYASLQGAEGAQQAVGVPTPEVFREIAGSIAKSLCALQMEVPLPNGQIIPAGKPALGVARACREGISAESPFADFREYLELVLARLAPLGLVLMLDEFDKLQEGIDNGVTSPQVPENIRFLIQTYPRFSAILTGSRRLKRLREEYWSALYGLGTSIPVTVLDAESARNVVTQPVRDRLTYSNEAIDRVVEVTARHPYLMQCLCNRVFDNAVQTRSRSITLGAINDAAASLVRDNEHFASLWDYAGQGPATGRQRRQLILLICALGFKQGSHLSFGALREQLAQAGVEVAEKALDSDLDYLRELELIDYSGEIDDGHYRLTIPLMADWIEQQQDADVVASRARTEAEEENV